MRILNAHSKEDRPKVAEGMIASYVRIYDQVANTPAPSHECSEIREQVLVLLQEVPKAPSKSTLLSNGAVRTVQCPNLGSSR
jgi:hypothetical protein